METGRVQNIAVKSSTISSLDFMLLFLSVLSPLMSLHDDSSHDEESNVS